jgi:hypothetical protein
MSAIRKTKSEAEDTSVPVRNNGDHTGPRINWSKSEYLLVARRFFALQDTHSEIAAVPMMEIAQRCLPEARRRPFSTSKNLVYGVVPRFKFLYDEWVTATPGGASEDRIAARDLFPGDGPQPEESTPEVQEQAAELVARAQGSGLQVKVGTEFPVIPVSTAIPVMTPPETPAPVVLSGPPLGPLELALQQMVGNAVNDQVGKLVVALREEQALMREQFQGLLSAQYDALMCYFDPAYKERCEAQSAYVPDPSNPIPFAVLTQMRVRQKRVLVSGGQTDQFHQVRLHFKGVDFTFIDGREPRKVGAGGFYDLVVCTKYTNHSARDALKRLHGNKVVMIDGAITALIATVKKYLDL